MFTEQHNKSVNKSAKFVVNALTTILSGNIIVNNAAQRERRADILNRNQKGEGELANVNNTAQRERRADILNRNQKGEGELANVFNKLNATNKAYALVILRSLVFAQINTKISSEVAQKTKKLKN